MFRNGWDDVRDDKVDTLLYYSSDTYRSQVDAANSTGYRTTHLVLTSDLGHRTGQQNQGDSSPVVPYQAPDSSVSFHTGFFVRYTFDANGKKTKKEIISRSLYFSYDNDGLNLRVVESSEHKGKYDSTKIYSYKSHNITTDVVSACFNQHIRPFGEANEAEVNSGLYKTRSDIRRKIFRHIFTLRFIKAAQGIISYIATTNKMSAEHKGKSVFVRIKYRQAFRSNALDWILPAAQKTIEEFQKKFGTPSERARAEARSRLSGMRSIKSEYYQ